MTTCALAARLAVISTFTLTASCGEISFLGPLSLPFGSAASEEVELFDGSLTAIGPNGFCVDPRSSDVANGFAVMAACASLGGSTGIPEDLALITLQVGQDGSAFDTDLEALRLVLEETDVLGDVSDVEVSENADLDAVVMAYRGPAPSSGVQARAFLDIADRSATLTVVELDQAALSLTGAKGLLIDALQRLRSANATVDPDAS